MSLCRRLGRRETLMEPCFFVARLDAPGGVAAAAPLQPRGLGAARVRKQRCGADRAFRRTISARLGGQAEPAAARGQRGSNGSAALVEEEIPSLWLPNPLATENEPRPAATHSHCLEVTGGGKLEGHVRISGAKNSALPLLAGCLLCPEPMELHNVPALKDIRRMCEVLESVGVKIKGGPGMLAVDASTLTSVSPAEAIVRTLRASFFVIGSLLGRMGEAEVPLPGGCAIGARPVDLHIRGLEALGASVEIRDGRVVARAPLRPGGGGTRRLVGCKIYMDYPSVGATETLMMAAALADGETVIENVAQEPEVVDLADLINAMGGRVAGAGSNCLIVQGVAKLHACSFTVIPDRIEAGTFLAAAAATGSEVAMSPVVPRHLTAVLAKLQETGCLVSLDRPDCLRIAPPAWGRPLAAVDITSLPYPGFPTDMQAQFMALLTRCSGTSVIRETVFENRMQHVPELARMGAAIKLTGANTAIVTGQGWDAPLWRAGGPAGISTGGGPRLTGAGVTASDLRAGAALVVAGLSAEGVTHVSGLEHLDRGYDRFELKLQGLGGLVRRVPVVTQASTVN